MRILRAPGSRDDYWVREMSRMTVTRESVQEVRLGPKKWARGLVSPIQ